MAFVCFIILYCSSGVGSLISSAFSLETDIKYHLLETADHLALVGDVNCIFVTFPCGILGQVWYLIVSFPDLCPLSYFGKPSKCTMYD